jgi:hypothetical protein
MLCATTSTVLAANPDPFAEAMALSTAIANVVWICGSSNLLALSDSPAEHVRQAGGPNP